MQITRGGTHVKEVTTTVVLIVVVSVHLGVGNRYLEQKNLSAGLWVDNGAKGL